MNPSSFNRKRLLQSSDWATSLHALVHLSSSASGVVYENILRQFSLSAEITTALQLRCQSLGVVLPLRGLQPRVTTTPSNTGGITMENRSFLEADWVSQLTALKSLHTARSPQLRYANFWHRIALQLPRTARSWTRALGLQSFASHYGAQSLDLELIVLSHLSSAVPPRWAEALRVATPGNELSSEALLKCCRYRWDVLLRLVTAPANAQYVKEAIQFCRPQVAVVSGQRNISPEGALRRYRELRYGRTMAPVSSLPRAGSTPAWQSVLAFLTHKHLVTPPPPRVVKKLSEDLLALPSLPLTALPALALLSRQQPEPFKIPESRIDELGEFLVRSVSTSDWSLVLAVYTALESLVGVRTQSRQVLSHCIVSATLGGAWKEAVRLYSCAFQQGIVLNSAALGCAINILPSPSHDREAIDVYAVCRGRGDLHAETLARLARSLLPRCSRWTVALNLLEDLSALGMVDDDAVAYAIRSCNMWVEGAAILAAFSSSSQWKSHLGMLLLDPPLRVTAVLAWRLAKVGDKRLPVTQRQDMVRLMMQRSNWECALVALGTRKNLAETHALSKALAGVSDSPTVKFESQLRAFCFTWAEAISFVVEWCGSPRRRKWSNECPPLFLSPYQSALLFSVPGVAAHIDRSVLPTPSGFFNDPMYDIALYSAFTSEEESVRFLLRSPAELISPSLTAHIATGSKNHWRTLCQLYVHFPHTRRHGELIDALHFLEELPDGNTVPPETSPLSETCLDSLLASSPTRTDPEVVAYLSRGISLNPHHLALVRNSYKNITADTLMEYVVARVLAKGPLMGSVGQNLVHALAELVAMPRPNWQSVLFYAAVTGIPHLTKDFKFRVVAALAESQGGGIALQWAKANLPQNFDALVRSRTHDVLRAVSFMTRRTALSYLRMALPTTDLEVGRPGGRGPPENEMVRVSFAPNWKDALVMMQRLGFLSQSQRKQLLVFPRVLSENIARKAPLGVLEKVIPFLSLRLSTRAVFRLSRKTALGNFRYADHEQLRLAAFGRLYLVERNYAAFFRLFLKPTVAQTVLGVSLIREIMRCRVVPSYLWNVIHEVYRSTLEEEVSMRLSTADVAKSFHHHRLLEGLDFSTGIELDRVSQRCVCLLRLLSIAARQQWLHRDHLTLAVPFLHRNRLWDSALRMLLRCVQDMPTPPTQRLRLWFVAHTPALQWDDAIRLVSGVMEPTHSPRSVMASLRHSWRASLFALSKIAPHSEDGCSVVLKILAKHRRHADIFALTRHMKQHKIRDAEGYAASLLTTLSDPGPRVVTTVIRHSMAHRWELAVRVLMEGKKCVHPSMFYRPIGTNSISWVVALHLVAAAMAGGAKEPGPGELTEVRRAIRKSQTGPHYIKLQPAYLRNIWYHRIMRAGQNPQKHTWQEALSNYAAFRATKVIILGEVILNLLRVFVQKPHIALGVYNGMTHALFNREALGLCLQAAATTTRWWDSIRILTRHSERVIGDENTAVETLESLIDGSGDLHLIRIAMQHLTPLSRPQNVERVLLASAKHNRWDVHLEIHRSFRGLCERSDSCRQAFVAGVVKLLPQKLKLSAALDTKSHNMAIRAAIHFHGLKAVDYVAPLLPFVRPGDVTDKTWEALVRATEDVPTNLPRLCATWYSAVSVLRHMNHMDSTKTLDAKTLARVAAPFVWKSYDIAQRLLWVLPERAACSVLIAIREKNHWALALAAASDKLLLSRHPALYSQLCKGVIEHAPHLWISALTLLPDTQINESTCDTIFSSVLSLLRHAPWETSMRAYGQCPSYYRMGYTTRVLLNNLAGDSVAHWEVAVAVFRRMPAPDVSHLCLALLSLAKAGEWLGAIELFQRRARCAPVGDVAVGLGDYYSRVHHHALQAMYKGRAPWFASLSLAAVTHREGYKVDVTLLLPTSNWRQCVRMLLEHLLSLGHTLLTPTEIAGAYDSTLQVCASHGQWRMCIALYGHHCAQRNKGVPTTLLTHRIMCGVYGMDSPGRHTVLYLYHLARCHACGMK